MERADVRMIQSRDGAGFPLETVTEFLVRHLTATGTA